MEPYQQRVVAEKADLDGKILALRQFLGTPAFEDLEAYQRFLLNRQLGSMSTYSHILGERIRTVTRRRA